MEENGIVPDIIDITPEHKIEVRYSDGSEVNFGNELTPLSVKDVPTVQWPVEEEQLYTLAMIDPDAPSKKRALFGPIKHWLVVNIPGTDLSKGESLAEYAGSGPPEGFGLHRYIFLVYKQSVHLKHSETPIKADETGGRMWFNVNKFAQKYNLGKPIAANFFLSQCDDYVRNKHAQMKSTFKGKMIGLTLGILRPICT